MYEVPEKCPNCGSTSLGFSGHGRFDDEGYVDVVTANKVWCDECDWEVDLCDEGLKVRDMWHRQE